MAKKKESGSVVLNIFVSILCLIIGFACGFLYPSFAKLPESDKYVSGELKIHFFELGNKYTGDSFLIQVGETEILVDGGSETSSLDAIYDYVSSVLYDDVIEYAIITHAHEDHIAAFGGAANGQSLFDKFTFENIIDFPQTESTSQIYGRYLSERNAEIAAGANHFSALDCSKNQNGATRFFDLGNGVQLEILYNYYYDHDANNENEYSVCFQINQGDRHFIFTGDLEKEGEIMLTQNNSLSPVVLFKAGHHGSNTSNSEEFLAVIQPDIVVVPCVAGSPQYTNENENMFPTQKTINAIAKYTTQVYAPSQAIVSTSGGQTTYTAQSLNGNIVVISDKNEPRVECSVSNMILKETDWFKANRDWPDNN